MFGINRLSPQTMPSSTVPTPEEHQLRRNVQTHDLAESYRMRRVQRAAEWAESQGLPPEIIGKIVQSFNAPFPTTNVSINTGGGASGIGTLGKLALGTALALGTGGAGLGLWSLLKPAVAPVIERYGSKVDMTIIPPGETP